MNLKTVVYLAVWKENVNCELLVGVEGLEQNQGKNETRAPILSVY